MKKYHLEQSEHGGYSSIDYRVNYYREKGIDVEVGDLMWYFDGAQEYDETGEIHNRKDILNIVKKEIYGHNVVNYNHNISEFDN